MKPKILIDMGFISHRAQSSMEGMETEDFQTGVIYGFFDQLYTICKKFRSNDVIIFCDSKHSYRKRAFPSYKEKRHEQRTQEEIINLSIMREQVKRLRLEILPEIGFPIYIQKGLESDDLMAWTACQLTRDNTYGVMVTSDGDLFQCITPFISWYDPQRDIEYNHQNFKQSKGVEIKDWWLYKVYAGCSSDNIPGIKGVGDKTAKRLLELGVVGLPDSKKQVYEEFHKSGDFLLFKSLIQLPHKKTKPIEITSPVYDPDVFFSYCEKFKINSFLNGSKRKKWEGFFDNKFEDSTLRQRGKGRLFDE